MTVSTFMYTSPVVGGDLLQDVIAGVFNNASYGGEIQIRRVAVYPVGGSNVANTAIAKFRFSRISAVSGGTAVTPSKNDTSSANLPSQVSLVVYPSSITETVQFLAPRMDCQTASQTVAGAAVVTTRFSGASSTSSMDLGGVYRQRKSATVESIVLAPGEGFAAILEDFGWPHEISFGVQVINTSTGATYTWNLDEGYLPTLKNTAFAALMNGSGSGVTLAIRVMESAFEGEAVPPMYRLARIGGISSNAVTSTAVSHDTRTPVPGWVQPFYGPARSVLKGANESLPLTWYSDHGAQVSVALQQKSGKIRARSAAPWGMDASSTLAPLGDQYLLYSDKAGLGPIVLGPGDGIAVLTGREGTIDQSAFSLWTCEIVFTTTEPQKLGASGSIIYA